MSAPPKIGLDERFGKLVTVRQVENSTNGARRWLCECDCGGEKIATAHGLLVGDNKSCGCLHTANHASKVGVGERFGKLVAIRQIKSKNRSRRWLCKCDCGGECVASASGLRAGHIKTCGGCPRYKERAGERYGKLVVTRWVENKSKTQFWLCKCDCGGKIIKSIKSLQDARTAKHCGCGQRSGGLPMEAGDRFGKLVAVRQVKSSVSGDRSWLCKCDCGGEKIAVVSALQAGRVKSCGCNRHLPCKTRIMLQIGDRFGRLVVKNDVRVRGSGRKQHLVYLCGCDCGNEVEVRGGSLRRASTLSCGCLSKEMRKRSSETRWRKIRGDVLLTPKNKAERDRFGRQMVQLIRQRDNFACVRCDQRRGKLPVHHIKPWSKYPELRFDRANLATLCFKCHMLAHDGNPVSGRVNAGIAAELTACIALIEAPVVISSKMG